MKKFTVEGFIPVSFSFEGIEAKDFEEAQRKAIEMADDAISTWNGTEKHTGEAEISFTHEEE